MTTLAHPVSSAEEVRRRLPVILGACAFVVLFWEPMITLGRDWWNDPEAGHGLLLGPLALWLVWKRGLLPDRRAAPVAGLVLLSGAVLLRYASGLAAELFTMRLSLLAALMALVVFAWGFRQLREWWLSFALLLLSIPLPAVLLNTLSLPLQLRASEIGAALLEWRHVPVFLSGNVIHLPGRSLFVTEACSGLRSLTALVALGVLMGGLWLKKPVLRVAILALAIPVALVLNGVRVFGTGFLVHYVDPGLGEGFMHWTEGWILFGVSFAILGFFTWGLAGLERVMDARRAT